MNGDLTLVIHNECGGVSDVRLEEGKVVCRKCDKEMTLKEAPSMTRVERVNINDLVPGHS